MPIARHGTGPTATLSAFASQVHPVFMLPPVASTWFGAALAGRFAPGPLIAVSCAAFFAVYTAHVTDGYVDFHRRGEDDDHPLTARGCRLAQAGATAGFLAALAALYWLVGPLAVLLVAPTWAIGYLHAPQFDTNPVTTTVGYPLGIAIGVVAGYYVQAGTVAATPLAMGLVFLVVLSGVKVIDDATDYAYDRSIDKRTVAVALGPARAGRVAYGLMAVGLFGVVAFTLDGLFPPGAPLAVPAFVAVALVARRADPGVATMLLVRGAYLLLAGLVVVVWYRPLAGVPLPDVTVLGPYTYLATELAFGAVALAVIAYTGSARRVARTVAVLYPIAYVWDWYTLEVGVFAIPLRTGVDLLGIPIEEHLFMLVVPAFALGVHELLDDVEVGPFATAGLPATAPATGTGITRTAGPVPDSGSDPDSDPDSDPGPVRTDGDPASTIRDVDRVADDANEADPPGPPTHSGDGPGDAGAGDRQG
jgi:lycopene cyclase domain-containing protein